MSLAHEIEAYYLAHLDELTPDKRFHFASRLAAWDDDSAARELLVSCQPEYVKASDEMLADIRQLLEHPPEAKINALTERQPFFDTYPELRGRILALFRVRHLRDIYGVDLTQEFLAFVSKDELYAMADRLEADQEAIKVLSTYAINYLYLVRRILYPDGNEGMIRLVETTLGIGQRYDTTNPTEIQLLIYLYMHCIIGAANFYHDEIAEDEREPYLEMVRQLEVVIGQNFETVNLDNKFEFLVCCRMLGYDTPLFVRIHDEAARSISANGTFVVDTWNHNAQSDKVTLSDSEHRNVLYIMSTRPYHASSSND